MKDEVLGQRQRVRTRLLGTRYSELGRKGKASRVIKLFLGLSSVLFLLFVAFGPFETPNETTGSVAPSAWYLDWTTKLKIGRKGLEQSDGDGRFGSSLGNSAFVSDESDFQGQENPTGIGGQDPAIDRRDSRYPWGTDKLSNDIRTSMADAGRLYLGFGIIAGFFGVLTAVGLATFAEWPIRTRIPISTTAAGGSARTAGAFRFFLALIEIFPKFLLLLWLYFCLPISREYSFALAMLIYNAFAATSLFRSRIDQYLHSEPYLYALEIGLPSRHIYLKHLLGRELFPLVLTQLPVMISSYIIWDCTLAYFDLSSGASWGKLILDGSSSLEYTFWIAMGALLVTVVGLYVLSDSLQEFNSNVKRS